MNTLVEYLYRDASNYKVWNKAVISGCLSDEQKKEIWDSCIYGSDFIPDQVGLPEERFSSWTEDDTDWFELLSISDTDEKATEPMAVEELHRNFLIAAEHWKEVIDEICS